METVKNIIIGGIAGIVLVLLAFYGIDREVARQSYVERTRLCDHIDGCLFDSNCEHFNEMIEEVCHG